MSTSKRPLPAPAGLLEAVRSRPEKNSGACSPLTEVTVSVSPDGPPIIEGGRNYNLAKVAGRLHDGSRDLSQLYADLSAINDARCSPPLPDWEVSKIARSIHGREPCSGLANSGPTPEVLENLENLEAAVLEAEWKGKGGKGERDVVVSLMKLARRHGREVEDGVEVTVSARGLALAASVGLGGAVRATQRLKRKDWIRSANAGRKDTEAGTLVLKRARKSEHSPTVSPRRGESVPVRAAYGAPRLRWTACRRDSRTGDIDVIKRLGKTAGAILDILEAHGGSATLAGIADALHMARTRDLKREDGPLDRLETRGIVEVRGTTVALGADWLEAVDRDREVTGELDAYRRDVRRYNEQSDAYRNRHQHPADPSPTEADMDAAREERERRYQADMERPVSPLAEAMRAYLERNPHHADEPAGWIGSTLWAYSLYDGKPTPAESKAALAELGGNEFLQRVTRSEAMEVA